MRYLIVGDTIIDENIFLRSNGISLETPTMKTEYLYNEILFGGAANVAINLGKYEKDISFITSLSLEKISIFKKKYPTIKIINCFQGKDHIKTRFWIKHGDANYKYLQINKTNSDKSNSLIDNLDLPF